MKKTFFHFFLCIATVQVSLAQVVAPQKVTPITTGNKVRAALPAPEPEYIDLENITEWLCPQTLVRGDREFDGHGPKVKCNVTLSLKNNNTEIWARIVFEAKETVHDWSTTSATWNLKVYTTPYGKKIKTILTDLFSRTEFISPKAGAQFLIPGSDIKQGLSTFFDGQVIAGAVLHAHGLPYDASPAIVAKLVETYMKGNEVVRTPSLEGTAVKYFHIVGDTGGDDISNDDNCNDDSRIEMIEFFPVKVIMVNVK
ncbi:MAG: hypothetical protein EOO13_08955 [Chitinophagaceae bacterium]|nr:MAG: hypothetical protein EOO13_08955 [Chitinophagaceae bacterium]